MNDYYSLRLDFTPCTEDATDVMAALLADLGYESFVPDELGLTAYVKAPLFDAAAVDALIADFPLPGFSIKRKEEFVEGRDWNSEWEKNYFKPIVVDNQCVIHSSFHTDFPACPYDIVIDPKMAFGTGHHATTSQIVHQLLTRPISGLTVVDMGTGTGILAILAAMRGAKSVIAIEIDPAAHINAVDNVALNHHPEIDVRLGDASLLADIEPVDLFLANINRNIICGDIEAYARTLKKGGTLILSGFYIDDIPVVEEAAKPFGLFTDSFTERDRWACLILKKE